MDEQNDQQLPPGLAEAARTFLQNIAENKCPTCQQSVEQKEQRGRCVYAKPCGHRLYQGWLKRGER